MLITLEQRCAKSRVSRARKINEISPRVKKLREELLTVSPEIFSERATLVTQSYEETFAQPQILRRAKAFDKLLRNMRLYLRSGELIVGNLSEKPRGAPIFPEYDVAFILEELDTFETRRADRFKITVANKEILRNLLPKWQHNTIRAQSLRLFSAEGKDASTDLISILTALGSGVGHMIVDYRLVLEKGLVCIQNEAKNLRAQLLPRSSDYFQTTSYYESVVTVCEAVITYAKRFASYAESLFQRETSSERRRELQIIAKNCRRVPAYPAETFWQALQSFWFIHVALQLESNGHSVSAGRFDQYIYPFLERDMQRHRITADFAEELLHCLWLKFNEVNKLRDRLSSVAFAGYPMYQNLILGGITPAGKDAANSLSYLCMQASEKVGLPQPSLSVRWHRAAEDKFLRRACEVSSYGMGLPAFFNDEILIPIMVAQGYSLKEARDYAIVGCVEPTVPGISEPWLTGGFLNLLKILELTINNGFDPIFEKQRAHKTGEIEDLQTFEHFYAAFLQQVSYYVQQQVLCDNILECAHAHLCPTPFQSALTADCLKNAKTTLEGGARYNTTTINIVGFANVVDSFSVIKHLVYEQRMVSWPELKQVLCDNFEEREAFRQLLLNRAPKFGNDNDTVDSLAKDLLSALSAEVDKYSNTRGGRYMVALYSIACHILLANKVGATPDGRKRSMLLADGGVSCVQGRDRQGPTAVVNSVAKLDHRKSPGGALLNLRLSPTLYNGQMGIENVAAMVKAFFLAAGQHVQFNVIDTETLRDAQAHPQNYPMLVVRVAGFSALFNTLSRLAQEDIIQRTEHMSG